MKPFHKQIQMRTRFKITAKEQAACLAKLFEEKGMELTLENLDKLPLNSDEANRKKGFTELFVASTPTGMTLMYYDKKRRVLKEVSEAPGILPDATFNMEMLEEIAKDFGPVGMEEEVRPVLEQMKDMSREEILKKFNITPDPEYKEPTAEELEAFEQELKESKEREEKMRKFMESLKALSGKKQKE